MVEISYDLSLIDNTTGREFETFMVELFEKLGYSTTVTNRSKDHGCDMMLQQGEHRIAVQAKRSESELNFTSVQRALDSLKKYHAQLAIVVTNNKFISSAKQLAKIKNVALIDMFIEIRGDNETSVQKDILLNYMEKFPLIFGTKADSEIFLRDMINEFIIFKPKTDHYNLV